MAPQIADPLLAAFSAGWEPPDSRPIVEWAKENIYLPLAYAIPGPFRPDTSRHILDPFAALEDDSRRMVNILKATQTFGTGIADIWVPWTLDNCPGPTMWNWNSDTLATQHAETRAMPVIRGVKRLARLMPDDRHAKRKKEILFRNGVALYIQGPSRGNLQGKSIRHEINDEVWEWPPGRLAEALARVTQYHKLGISKVLNISQGGVVGDDWHNLTADGDFFEWEVQCPHCGEYQVLRMEERDKDRKRIYRMKWDDAGDNIYYECAFCAKSIYDSDAQRAAFNETGRYHLVRPGKDREVVTYTWSSLIWLPWSGLVKRYRECLAAKKLGALLPLKAYVQKVFAGFWNESDHIEITNLQIRYLTYVPEADPKPLPIKNTDGSTSPAPAGSPLTWLDGFEERYRFMTVDCQADFLEFWIIIRAWGAGQSRRLLFGKVDSWEAVREKQLEWKVRSQFVGVDSGYRASEVYRQCCRYVDETGRGWVALKGSPAESFIHTFPGTGRDARPSEKRVYSERQFGDHMLGMKNRDVEKWLSTVSPHALALYQRGKLRCPLYLWSNPSVKDITANLRDGKGMPWFAPSCDQNSEMEVIYTAHMGSEPKVLERDSRGNEKWAYHQVGDNHGWDCENQNTAFAIIAGEIPLPVITS